MSDPEAKRVLREHVRRADAERFSAPAAESPPSAEVADLAMLVRQLVHQVRKSNPESALAGRAADYLKRYGLQGSVLREEGEDR